MSDASNYDVVVVGASLAGCTAATLLAKQGLSVALLERALQAKGAIRNPVEAWSRFGWMPWLEGEAAGYNLRRQVLDPMLRELASSTPGVTLLLGHSVTQVI